METTNFKLLDATVPRDYDNWLKIWNLWHQKEIFANPNYVNLYVDSKSKAYCAILESIDGYVMYPFMLRDLTKEEFCSIKVGFLSDTITPYGYGGAFTWGDGNLDLLTNKFWECYDSWALENNVVSEVIKIALFNESILDYPGQKDERLQNIVVNLDVSESDLWSSFEHKVRKNVKKAISYGVKVISDTRGEAIDEFIKVYTGTLDRRDADDRYYFGQQFFEKIHSNLPGQFIYFHAMYQDRIISTELVLISADKVYSFLGGTCEDSFHMRPNDLLKYEIILWAKRQGKSKFVLGGGNRPNDGIYNYKRSFSPKGSMPFYIGTRIFRPDIYELLINDRKAFAIKNKTCWSPKYGNIPEYRS